MSDLRIITQFFNAGVAEKEQTFLNNVYVPFDDLEKIMTINEQEMKIIVGNKGCGKSALLNYILFENEENGIPTLLFKPDDLNINTFHDNVSIAEVKGKIYDQLIFEIAARIGRDLPSFVSESQNKLLIAAEEKGYKDANSIKAFLKMFGKTVAKADLEDYYKIKGRNSYVRALSNYDRFQNKLFFILFDDVDQIASRENNNFYYVIWGLILAVAKIAEIFPNIKPIISLRTEIWRGLNQIDSKNDQIDHLIPMKYVLNPSAEDLIEILRKRLEYCVAELGKEIGNGDLYTPFFEGQSCILPLNKYIHLDQNDLMGNEKIERRLWETYLITSSRFRPRDTVNLVSMLAHEAIDNNREKITNQDVFNTAYRYSEERVNFLCQENNDRTSKLKSIINYFSKGQFENYLEDLLEFMKPYLSSGILKIDGKQIYDTEDDLLTFLEFLYDIEFIYPRDVDTNAKSYYKYIRPLDEPNLIKSSNINDLKKYRWDIHPSYRSYLEVIRAQSIDRNEVKKLSKAKNKKGLKVNR